MSSFVSYALAACNPFSTSQEINYYDATLTFPLSKDDAPLRISDAEPTRTLYFWNGKVSRPKSCLKIYKLFERKLEDTGGYGIDLSRPGYGLVRLRNNGEVRIRRVWGTEHLAISWNVLAVAAVVATVAMVTL
jgi:hypothetical protein